jgi:competence protein ComEC
VVDVGAGLCTVTEIPNGHYLIYDAGHWQSTQCLAAAREIVDGDVVDLLIVSHTDSDHLGEAEELLAAFNVRHIIRTGMVRTSDAWANFRQAASREVLDGASVMNLQSASLIPGTTIALGDATVTLVAGWGVWTGSTGLTTAERRNVVSIVVRLDSAGSSILYTGDTVGRRITDGASACKDAEAFMVANHDAGVVSLKANVIIAPTMGRPRVPAPAPQRGRAVQRPGRAPDPYLPDRPGRRRERGRKRGVGQGPRGRVQRPARG